MAYKQLKLWFDEELAQKLANDISNIYPEFLTGEFVKRIRIGVAPLELKDRVELIADQFYHLLHENFEVGWQILSQILGPENDQETGMFTNFYWIMPIAKYVEKYGLDNFDMSMDALREITKRNTSEYAIRPFIVRYPVQTLEVMLNWAHGDNAHIRRLASEGGRPRLPWATKLEIFIDDPRPLIPILDILKDDDSKYVQKSVANCLNDIFKDNYKVGQETIDRWNNDQTPQRTWIIKHSLRSLIKKEDLWAKSILKV